MKNNYNLNSDEHIEFIKKHADPKIIELNALIIATAQSSEYLLFNTSFGYIIGKGTAADQCMEYRTFIMLKDVYISPYNSNVTTQHDYYFLRVDQVIGFTSIDLQTTLQQLESLQHKSLIDNE